MELDRKQLSLLITVLTMSLVVLSLFNIHLNREGPAEEYVVEMAMDEDLEELFPETPEEDKEAQQAEAIKSHMAYNQTAKPSYGNPEPLKTLEELQEERAAANGEDHPDDLADLGEYAARVKELAEKRREKRELLGEREAQKKEYTDYLAERRTSVSYSLVDRNALDLPPPIYTCLEGGKVVINIEVDALGKVTDASFNEKSSSTNNGCLVENAITYALKARFNSATKTAQKGSITYLFQGK